MDVTTARTWQEARRFRAWVLKQRGWSQAKIAEALGVSQASVSQWLKRARADGVEALRTRAAPGNRWKLTPPQRTRLLALLAEGAEAHGFRGALWTQGRVAALVERHFGVRYDATCIGRVLRRLGWSCQKPARQARQRDEAAIAAWRGERWPALLKKRRPSGARSCSSMSRASTRCRRWCGPTPPRGRRRC